MLHQLYEISATTWALSWEKGLTHWLAYLSQFILFASCHFLSEFLHHNMCWIWKTFYGFAVDWWNRLLEFSFRIFLFLFFLFSQFYRNVLIMNFLYTRYKQIHELDFYWINESLYWWTWTFLSFSSVFFFFFELRLMRHS